jgi:lipid-A-disaccharide synthase
MGKLLIRNVRFFSLVNLIGERLIIPELLQDAANPEQIAKELHRMLEDIRARELILAGLLEVRQRLGAPGASDRAATVALKILNNEQIHG